MAYKAAWWASWDWAGGRCDGALALRVDSFRFGVFWGVGESVVFIVGDREEEGLAGARPPGVGGC